LEVQLDGDARCENPRTFTTIEEYCNLQPG